MKVTPRHRRMAACLLLTSTVLASTAVGAASATATTHLQNASASAAKAGQPWRNTTLPARERAEMLVNVLTREQKVQAALGNMLPLATYGVPTLPSQDGPNGISLPGTTVFPSGYSLASTFDPDLAYQYGSAIGAELRGKGQAAWLGPGLDIARTPYAGRQSESFGEDPELTAQLGRQAVLGAKSQDTIQTLKHFVANNHEYGRIGFQDEAGGRTPGVDVELDERTLREVYAEPFLRATRDGGADSVMCSYNRVNGIQACENPELLSIIKDGWDGVVTPDYGNAVRDQAAAAKAGVDLPQFDQGNGGRTADLFTSGAVSDERLNDMVTRILIMIFSSGLYDHPVTTVSDVVSTAEHRALATRVAAEGMVLLDNDGTLPLTSGTGQGKGQGKGKGSSIAVLGPSGQDAMYTIGGSAAVTTTVGENITPLQGIKDRAGKSVTVRSAQGSFGDVAATDPVPAALLSAPSTGAAGWDASYWNNLDAAGEPALQQVQDQISFTGAPEGVQDRFSAHFTTTLTPSESGLYRFTMLQRGLMSMSVDGQEIASGTRESTQFIAGPFVPVSGTVQLEAGKSVTLELDYSTAGASWGSGSLQLAWQTPSQSKIAEAVELARTSDVAVVMANFAASEGMDRSSLSLPGDQNALIEAVAAVNPRTVVVLNTGGAVTMPWVDDVAAVVQAWYPGQQFGEALAQVLFGDVDPVGRLPVTFPANETQGPTPKGEAELYPGQDGKVVYEEGIHVGYRWYDHADQNPLFSFGHGLSYTTFAYSDPVVESTPSGLRLSMRVANTGQRAGTAVPQVYAMGGQAPVELAERSLAGFGRVDLQPGQQKRITIDMSAQAFSYWDENSDRWTPVLEGRSLQIGSGHGESLIVPVPTLGEELRVLAQTLATGTGAAGLDETVRGRVSQELQLAEQMGERSPAEALAAVQQARELLRSSKTAEGEVSPSNVDLKTSPQQSLSPREEIAQRLDSLAARLSGFTAH
jgi:beta-glucosidase